jgi:D-sedoheptulose 7-phosphate isomerase
MHAAAVVEMMSAPDCFLSYSARLQAVLSAADWNGVGTLAKELLDCWKGGRQVFLCGNGGSAGNAMHLANDLLYGISREKGHALRVFALPANSSVVTCLANDQGYEDIFSHQLAVLAREGDILIALSGSGNSPNIIKALDQAREIKMKSFAILGFGGGKAKELADIPIHFEVDDMQIAEDMQLVVGHMVMQWLYKNKAMAR